MKDSNEGSEISLSEIIENIKGYTLILKNKWKIILLMSFICSLIGFGLSYIIKPTYTAKVSFLVEEGDKGGGMLSSYMSLASQFGVSGAGGSSFGPDNVIEIIKSDKVIIQALLTKVDINNKKEILANYYIEKTGLKEKFAKNDKLNGFKFSDSVKFENFSIQEDSVLLSIVESVSKKISADKANKQASLLLLSYSSIDQNLSKLMAEELIKSVSDIYIKRKTDKSRKTLTDIQQRADSVKRELSSTDFQLAKTRDVSRRLIMAVGSVNEAKLSRDQSILSIMYGEIVKNLELTKMTIANQTPLIAVIDTPILPLQKEVKLTKKIGLVVGFIIGYFLSSLIIILLDGYKKEIE
jgi:uncharacterized protein involved in exopolysaccharide biosynthesis